MGCGGTMRTNIDVRQRTMSMENSNSNFELRGALVEYSLVPGLLCLCLFRYQYGTLLLLLLLLLIEAGSISWILAIVAVAVVAIAAD